MKLPRLNTERRGKWAGTAVALVLASLFAYSCFSRFGFSYYDEHSSSPSTIEVSRGRLGFTRIDPRRVSSALYGETKPWWRLHEPFRLKLMPSIRWTDGYGGVFIPLWIPFLLVAAPTAWLWRSERRAKPWQCPKCRYDLRGLEGGVCPECGESTEREV